MPFLILADATFKTVYKPLSPCFLFVWFLFLFLEPKDGSLFILGKGWVCFFLGPHLQHMEVPRLGVESEL